MTKIALIDIDGVLANDTHRVQYALDRNYYQYFNEDRMYNDTLFPQGKRMVEWLMANGWSIEYMTGRREDRREITAEWLYEQGLPIGILHMRTRAETMRLAEFKRERIEKMYEELSTELWDSAEDETEFPEIVLWDDDPEVVRVVREALGEGAAKHCTWHIKPKKMVRTAVA